MVAERQTLMPHSEIPGLTEHNPNVIFCLGKLYRHECNGELVNECEIKELFFSVSPANKLDYLFTKNRNNECSLLMTYTHCNATMTFISCLLSVEKGVWGCDFL